MFRDPAMNDNGAQRRADRILAENVDEATKWISVQPYQRVNIMAHPACLETDPVGQRGCGGHIQDFPTPSICGTQVCYDETHICVKDIKTVGADACVILERKFGGQRDCEASVVAIYEFTGTPFDPAAATQDYLDMTTVNGGRGFFRLRVARLGTPTRLFIERVPAADFL